MASNSQNWVSIAKKNIIETRALKDAIGIKEEKEKSKNEKINILNNIIENKITDFLIDYINDNNITTATNIEEINFIGITKFYKFDLKREFESLEGIKKYYHCAIFGNNDTTNYNFRSRIKYTKTNIWFNIKEKLNKIGFSIIIITKYDRPNIILINSIDIDYIYKKFDNFRLINNLDDIFNETYEWNELWHGFNNWMIGKEDIKIIETIIIKYPIVEKQIVEIPIVEKQIVEIPIVEIPIVEIPIVEIPIVEKQIVEIPIVEIPIVEKQIVEKQINIIDNTYYYRNDFITIVFKLVRQSDIQFIKIDAYNEIYFIIKNNIFTIDGVKIDVIIERITIIGFGIIGEKL